MNAEPVIRAATVCSALLDLGYRFATGVPCSSFDGVLALFEAGGSTTYVPAANEGAALAIASGAALAGRRAVVLIQNSGVGNLINPLTSLSLVYDIPCLVLVSMRGTDDGPQHRVMGEATAGLLREMGVPFWTLPPSDGQGRSVLAEADAATRSGRPAFVLVPPGTIAGGPEAPARPVPAEASSAASAGPGPAGRALTRKRAIAVIDGWLTAQYVVGTTGYIARELFGARDRDRNFYMQGSMGHAAAIGLGLALGRPDRKVVVLDGDGALLMHLGILSTIGAAGAPNLTHVVLDNGAYESTGGQRTTSGSTRLEEIALACGYGDAAVAGDEDELRLALAGRGRPGPRLVRVMIRCRGEPDGGWATDAVDSVELGRRFEASLGPGEAG
jgi:phosphonopyruvate decarboxylase